MHWLSFADGDLPAGSQFLGVAIVAAPDFMAAVMMTHSLGCNPGGEVQGVEFDAPAVPENFVNRLLSRDDIAELEGIWRKAAY